MAALTLAEIQQEVRWNIGRTTSGVTDARLLDMINWSQQRIADTHTFEEMNKRLYNYVLEDCEDAWVAKTNVTSTASTDYVKRGTYASKNVIAAAHGTGLVATEDFTAVSLVDYTHVKFWIRSTVANAAGGLQLILDDTAACASATESLNITALTADTWSEQTLKLASPSSLTAILSVGLNVVTDIGAQTVYIDDIRMVRATEKDVKLYNWPTRMKDLKDITLQDGSLSRKLTYMTPRQFDLEIPRSEDTTSYVPYAYIDNESQFELYPIPDGVYALNIRFSQYPIALSAATDVSALLRKDHLIVACATAYAFAALRQYEDNQAWHSIYKSYLIEAINSDHSAEDWQPAAREFRATSGGDSDPERPW